MSKGEMSSIREGEVPSINSMCKIKQKKWYQKQPDIKTKFTGQTK